MGFALEQLEWIHDKSNIFFFVVISIAFGCSKLKLENGNSSSFFPYVNGYYWRTVYVTLPKCVLDLSIVEISIVY